MDTPDHDRFKVRTPFENVMEILATIRSNINPGERKYLEDLNYCIRIIGSNKLYDMSSIIKKVEKGGNKQEEGAKQYNKEELGWVQNFSKQQNVQKDTRRMSKFIGLTGLAERLSNKGDTYGTRNTMNTKQSSDAINLITNKRVKILLSEAINYDFNVFKLKDET